jgi:hypothetical protein
MRQLATIVLIVLTIIVSAVYLPMLYGKLFFKRIEKTHLLYSPVTERFVYREKIVGPVPRAAAEKAEDHHAEIACCDVDGVYYSRVDFEKKLPFIYYKNMELWGLLPLRLSGREFDKVTIRRSRQVLELKPDEINGRRPQTPVWPLLESNPGQARLVFPEDRFRMTTDAMQFINADTNTVDEDLTTRFTQTLKAHGFVFPARSVNGKFTILKPFDEGVFLVDAEYNVFHVKRRNGQPVVVQTPIDPALRTRHIKISENKRREFYGLLLAGDGSIHLLTYDTYSLVSLPLEHYDSDRMDFKVIVNPLYRTAIYSDEAIIRAVAMNKDYQPIDTYTHRMSRATATAVHRVYDIIFPFTAHLKTGGSGYLRVSVLPGDIISLIGLLCCFGGYMIWHRIQKGYLPTVIRLCLVAATGVYGLIALGFIGTET